VAKLVLNFYKLLMAVVHRDGGSLWHVLLGVIAREVHWDIGGLDAYAGYAIAATLFLALPATLQHGDHIRVTLVLTVYPPNGGAHWSGGAWLQRSACRCTSPGTPFAWCGCRTPRTTFRPQLMPHRCGFRRSAWRWAASALRCLLAMRSSALAGPQLHCRRLPKPPTSNNYRTQHHGRRDCIGPDRAAFCSAGLGLWIGLSLLAVALIGMELFTSRPVGDSMMLTIWGSTSSWTLTALPLFLWMGEILFRSKLSDDMFKGLAPWLDRLPGRLLHTNVVGCTIFAAVSGSSAATCATIGKITLPELKKRGYPDDISMGTLAGAGTLGLLIPPSIIMIVYGVAANVSIAKLFLAGVIPGLMLAALFMGYIIVWACSTLDKVPAADAAMSFGQKVYASRHLIPVVSLIALVLGGIYSGIATATEAAALGVAGR
jgi:hypothetical protein